MTENMAGRGEGLAGLAKEWRERAAHEGSEEDLAYKLGMELAAEQHRRTRLTLEKCIADLAALEAAPAGTAPMIPMQHPVGEPFIMLGRATDLLDRAKEAMECDPQRDEVGSDCWIWCHQTDLWLKEVAALATPSPQAPPEQSNAFSPTSAREQSSATASGNQGTGDGYLDTHLAGRIAARLDEYEFVAQMVSGVRKEDWFKRRIADLEARYKRAAATQEQPAGSAPSGSTRPNVYTIQEVSMGRRAKNCNCGETPCMCKMFEEEMKLEEAEQKEAETGSPRKVGEDGVGELKVGDVVLVEATISGVSRFEDGQVSGEDLLHLRVANGHGSIVRRCVARPSSVPVGEQKQEEGV